jgi:hypothetical protein
VQKADMRIDSIDDLAIELEYEAQDAMGGRMLRAEIDVEVADFSLSHGSYFAAFSSPGST